MPKVPQFLGPKKTLAALCRQQKTPAVFQQQRYIHVVFLMINDRPDSKTASQQNLSFIRPVLGDFLSKMLPLVEQVLRLCAYGEVLWIDACPIVAKVANNRFRMWALARSPPSNELIRPHSLTTPLDPCGALSTTQLKASCFSTACGLKQSFDANSKFFLVIRMGNFPPLIPALVLMYPRCLQSQTLMKDTTSAPSPSSLSVRACNLLCEVLLWNGPKLPLLLSQSILVEAISDDILPFSKRLARSALHVTSTK